jgi:hypothetical protein
VAFILNKNAEVKVLKKRPNLFACNPVRQRICEHWELLPSYQCASWPYSMLYLQEIPLPSTEFETSYGSMSIKPPNETSFFKFKNVLNKDGRSDMKHAWKVHFSRTFMIRVTYIKKKFSSDQLFHLSTPAQKAFTACKHVLGRLPARHAWYTVCLKHDFQCFFGTFSFEIFVRPIILQYF